MAEYKQVDLQIGTEAQFETKKETLPVGTIVGITDPIHKSELDSDLQVSIDIIADKLDKPSGNPTEDSLVKVSSTGSTSYFALSTLVDLSTEQTLTAKKTWGTRTGSWYEVAEISNTGILAESGGKNPEVEVSPETYTRTHLGGFSISQSYKESGNATEYYSSFMFPIYKEGSQGTYYFSIAPYDNPTADSVIVTGIDRKPVWKPLSEFILGNNFNIGNGTGQGSLIQTNVKSSDNTPYTNIASGPASIALGKNTKAQGNTDFVIGQNNTANASGSFVGGINCSNTNESNYSFVFGNYINNTYAPNSFVFGKDIENSKGNVVILGSDNVNPLENAFLIGRGLRSQDYINPNNNNAEYGITILGRYNKRATQGEDVDGTSFIIGDGTSDANRHNAIKLSDVKGLECFIEPKTDYGIVRKLELNSKIDKPANPTETSVVTLTSTGTVGTKKLSEFATTTYMAVTIPWTNVATNGFTDAVRKIESIANTYEHSLYIRLTYGDWNAEVFLTIISTESSQVTSLTTLLGSTYYHEASGTIHKAADGDNYYLGQIQNVSHNGVKVLIPESLLPDLSIPVTVNYTTLGSQSAVLYDGQDKSATEKYYLNSGSNSIKIKSGYAYIEGDNPNGVVDVGYFASKPTVSGGVTIDTYSPTSSGSNFGGSCIFKVSSAGTINIEFQCLIEGTQITLADGSIKAIEDITYDDELLVWNFYEGKFDKAKPTWIKVVETAPEYNLVKFSNGAEVGFVGAGGDIGYHRVFNKEAKTFTHTGVKDTPNGTTTFAQDESYPTITSQEVIREEVKYYNVITDKHYNLFANGILTSCRLSNKYCIEDMKYVGDELISDSEEELYFQNIENKRK